MRVLLLLFYHFLITGNQKAPVIKIKSIATMRRYNPNVVYFDSLTVYKGVKYTVLTAERFNNNGKPVEMKERHAEGFASWYATEFQMVVKDHPDSFVLSGWIIKFDKSFLNLNKHKLTITERDASKKLLVGRNGKTLYFINYY